MAGRRCPVLRTPDSTRKSRHVGFMPESRIGSQSRSLSLCRSGISVLVGNPIENLRRCHRFLRRMGIQGPSNGAPTLLDHLLSKLLRLSFRLKSASRTNRPALSIAALGRNVRTIGNVPSIGTCRVLNPQPLVTSGSSCQRNSPIFY